jgi:nicotinate-nucleotide pyrophosphorylase (carboxylating)
VDTLHNGTLPTGLDDFLRMSLGEDIGSGDITTRCCVPADTLADGALVAKEPGVICGLAVAARVFGLLDGAVAFDPLVSDGDPVETGCVVARLRGPAASILAGERTALNILQHLSGVATLTARFVRQVSGYGAKIADTRKTTPGMRALEKYAVRCGGGTNHRFGLYDGILIKDNHIAVSGGVENALRRARAGAPHTLKIEIETETLEQVSQAGRFGADIIMLDNMPPELAADAVELIGGRALTEASGNMGERDLARYAAAGVDIISIGALTHSVKAMDISLKFNQETAT